MKTPFQIMGTDKLEYSCGDIGAGDNIRWAERKSLKAAMNCANKLLQDPEVYSVWIERWDEDGEMMLQYNKYEGETEFRRGVA